MEPEQKEIEQRWHFWRGSPELLAHVMRSAVQAVGGGGRTEARCTIDLEVAGDHERFSSPSQFLTDVTREALRHFTRIEITAAGEQLEALIRLAWNRPWWKPGEGMDAEVLLRVTGPDEEARSDAVEVIQASIQRGKTRVEGRQGLIGIALAYLFTAALVLATASALYLLKASTELILWVAGVVFVIGLIIGGVFGTWAYPSLEVASTGQTNLSRMVRFSGPLIVGFILTGLAKALYG